MTKAADSRSMSWPASAAANAPRSYQVGQRPAALDVGAGFVDAQLPRRSHDPRTELDGRQVPLTDRTQAQHEPGPARLEARLVGMGDGRRIEEGGGLDRVLVGEPGTDEAAARVGQHDVVRHPVGDPLVVGLQHTRQVAVPRGVAVTHPAQDRTDLVLGQREDPPQDPGRPGPAVVRELLSGDEQPRQDPCRVGGEDAVRPGDALCRATWVIRRPSSSGAWSGGRRAPSTGPAATSRAAPRWTPRPGSRCARRVPDRRSRPRSPGRASG